MTFLAPLQLLWLGMAVPVILLYVLRRRRQRRIVSTTFLWAQAQRDLLAEQPWRRLVPTVSLLLQLLVIIVAALALARPVGGRVEERGAIVAVVVDVSASMAVEHEGRTRLDEAREVTRDLVSGLSRDGRLMIIEAGQVANVALAPTGDVLRVAQVSAELAVRGASADLEGGIALALEALEDAPPGSRVVVVSDGAEAGGALRVPTGREIAVHWVGESGVDNVGIVALDVRPSSASEEADDAEVFVRVQRHAPESAGPRTVFVTIELVQPDGERRGVVASRRLVLGPNARQNVVLRAAMPPDARGRAPVVRARLAADEAGETDRLDPFRLDDVAVAPSPSGRRLPVFAVGTPPRSLQRMLRADPQVELFATTLERLQSLESPLEGFHVFAGGLPVALPPGDALLIAPTGDVHDGGIAGLTLAESVAAPRVARWDETDPRLRFVSFADVHLASARPIRADGLRTLVEADVGPLVGVVERPAGELTVVSFDTDRSDWPRQPSFVVFFRNLLERARDRRASGAVAPGALGEALRVPVGPEAEVRVVLPDGDERRTTARSEVALVPVPALPGIYRVEVAEGDEEPRNQVALRSLLDEGESDPTRRLAVQVVAPELVDAEGEEQETEGDEATVVADAGGPRELASLFALALLVFVAGDLLWWRRRSGKVSSRRSSTGART